MFPSYTYIFDWYWPQSKALYCEKVYWLIVVRFDALYVAGLQRGSQGLHRYPGAHGAHRGRLLGHGVAGEEQYHRHGYEAEGEQRGEETHVLFPCVHFILLCNSCAAPQICGKTNWSSDIMQRHTLLCTAVALETLPGCPHFTGSPPLGQNFNLNFIWGEQDDLTGCHICQVAWVMSSQNCCGLSVHWEPLYSRWSTAAPFHQGSDWLKWQR